MKDIPLSYKRIVYSNASGRNIVRYEEKDVAEFIRRLKEEILEWDWQANEQINIIDRLSGDLK